jgi:hypothetical protein
MEVFDENNDLQRVTKLYVNGMSDVYEIEDEDGNAYKFTGNHKIKTTKGWKRVDELTVDVEVIEPKIKRITKLLEKELTVDIEVANTHSYQLANGWVSHNTVSQLVDCASGIHPRWSEYYVRNVLADKKDPMAQFMVKAGFPHEDSLSKPGHMWVFGFPVKSPDGAVVGEGVKAIEHLELWKMYQDHWCEHKPSCTVNIRESEWLDVGAWVYRYFDEISGIAFMPASGHSFKQMPYQECSKAEYEALLVKMPKEVDWMKMKEFEMEDCTAGPKTLACSGEKGTCEVVDLT